MVQDMQEMGRDMKGTSRSDERGEDRKKGGRGDGRRKRKKKTIINLGSKQRLRRFRASPDNPTGSLILPQSR